jgi:hypothetical protein
VATDWDEATLKARISDTAARTRHAGGSPNATEIAAYAAALPSNCAQDRALVLGMTPELRRLALERFAATIAVDHSADAIALYRDWVAPDDAPRETLIHGDWLRLPSLVETPVAAVLGDGISGNLPNLDAHRAILDAIRQMLLPRGRFVTRQAMMPRDFDPVPHRASALVERFRAGAIDEAEFGFGMRLVGHYESCYDRETFTLDNAALFARCDEAHARGELNDREYAAIRRYYFGGRNCILSQDAWERVLDVSGFRYWVHPCSGKEWYAYYVVYECEAVATRHSISE